MINLSLPFNNSLLHPNSSSIIYSLPYDVVCLLYGRSSVIYITSRIIYIFLLLPLSILIFYQGLQRWRQNPSYFSSASMTHCDCISYNIVIMELIGVVGCIICSWGVFMKNFNILQVGSYIFFSKWYGWVLFHVLTCLERYMAVVHPMTYLGLRNKQGIRIRNITIASVWLISLVGTSLFYIESILYWELSFLMLALVIISFCSVSVLCALIHPGPGEQGKDRKKIDQSKQRAFFTIVASFGVLMLGFSFNVSLELVFSSTTNCDMLTCVYWAQLPIYLLFPIFFLYKERKSYSQK